VFENTESGFEELFDAKTMIFDDEVLRLCDMTPRLYRRDDYLAVPLAADEPCAFVHLLAYSDIKIISGECYAIFNIKDGKIFCVNK